MPMGDALTLVVPVFDEAARVDDFATSLIEYASARPGGVELLFVDDGSGDATATMLEAHLSARPDVSARVLRRPHLGKGAAVAAGLAAAGAPVAAFCDLDLSTPLDQLDVVIATAERAGGLAIASRDLAGSRLTRPEGAVRELLGKSYNRLLQATVTPGVVDTQCGAKAAATDVWERLLVHTRESGFAWDAELVAVALALGVRVHEVPVEWHHDARSKIRVGRDGVRMVQALPRIVASRQRARAARPRDTSAVPVEVFDDANAAALAGADREHWWFRSKAALVATAIRRTQRDAPSGGWLVDVGGGAGGGGGGGGGGSRPCWGGDPIAPSSPKATPPSAPRRATATVSPSPARRSTTSPWPTAPPTSCACSMSSSTSPTPSPPWARRAACSVPAAGSS
jgi:hypothetical protein